MLRQSLSDHALAVSSVIAPRCVVVVYAIGHRVVDHLLHSCRVRSFLVAVYDRQPHAAEAESGQLQIFKTVVVHIPLLSLAKCRCTLYPLTIT